VFQATCFLHLQGWLLCSHCHENVQSAIDMSVYMNDALTFHLWLLVSFLKMFDYLLLTLVFFFWKICSSFCVNWLLSDHACCQEIYNVFLTGRVDYIGSSHQWWHLFVVLALYYWHNTGIKYVEFRMNHGCATDLRLWQYGLHRFLCNSICWTTLPVFMEEQFQRPGY
jgi:Haemolysin-III related.